MEIHECLEETEKLSKSLQSEPTQNNLKNIKRMVKIMYRMVKLMVTFGPGSATDQMLRGKGSRSGSATSAQVDAEQKKLEENFKRHIETLQGTVKRYEMALERAEKNQSEEFRGIMGPIVKSIQDGQ